MIPFKLAPEYREYVWGGKRLRPDVGKTAEAWIVYEENKIIDGPFTGSTLAQISDSNAVSLLGSKVVDKFGKRFPLLIKLLDCADWLSLQVHPNDEQAEQLEGPGHFGKTEAWYVVEADDSAQLLGGFREGVKSDDVKSALHDGSILNLVQRHEVQTGDAIFIPAGLIHALGPGLLIYEIQQTSDITYRVYDWDRPKTSGRKLHLDQAAITLNPNLEGALISSTSFADKKKANIVTSEYFSLDLLSGISKTMDFDTCGEAFSVLTVLDGKSFVRGDGWKFELAGFETLLIPAICGKYQVELFGDTKALSASAL